jgi:acetyltransferase-like isoleucine patch superfamily enzyme
MIPWPIKKPFAILRWELTQWLRASLIRVPGSIGCWLRGKFYGYQSGPESRVFENVVIYHPQKLRLGKNVQIAVGCHINAGGGIEIADNTLIGPRVSIWSQNHIYTSADVPICEQGYEFRAVKIEEDVWIGCGAIILPGVSIARGCVIGAGAVVTCSTEPFMVYAGVPARAIAKRTGNQNMPDFSQSAPPLLHELTASNN